MVQHILPINDSGEHEEATTCNCQPKVINENGNMIVVHNSFDGREAVDEFNKILEIKNRVQYDLIKNKCPLAFMQLKKMFDDEDYGVWLNPGYNGYLNYWESRDYGVVSNKTWNERNLFDFFDKYKFYPQINKGCGDEISFYYTYNVGVTEIHSDQFFSERKASEAACFTVLFYELEKVLLTKK